MVVGGGNESYSELGIVSGSCAGDWVDIIVLLLHRTRIVGLQAGIVELGGKGECHVLDGNVTDWGRWKQISIEHTQLICLASSLVPGLSQEVNFGNVRRLELTNLEGTSGSRHSVIVADDVGGVGCCRPTTRCAWFIVIVDDVLEIKDNLPVVEGWVPCWEVVLLQQLQGSSSHTLTLESVGIGRSLSRIRLQSSITVSVDEINVWTPLDVNHAHLLILHQVGNLYPGDVAEGVFEVIVRGQCGSEGYG